MPHKTLSKKILVLGIDGMDPSLTKKYLDMGLMPNTKEFLKKGSAREDLVLLGGQPTVTPPMWTTLATGANPNTHGITCFNGQADWGEDLDKTIYNIDSRRCQAEQLWNVFAEAGKKTLVWHWPGSSWPPSSDSPNLSVVDGLTPAVINAAATCAGESMIVCNINTPEATFVPKAASDGNIPCVIDPNKRLKGGGDSNMGAGNGLILFPEDGEHALSSSPFDAAIAPIKDPSGWNIATDDAKETTLLFANGLIRRPTLILKENGKYTKAAVYKTKKDTSPLYILENNVFYTNIIDDAYRGETKVNGSRNMRILELSEDGNKMRIWVSPILDTEYDQVFHPKSLYKDIVENCGIPATYSLVGGGDRQLIEDCMIPSWDNVCKWYADCLNFLAKERNYEIIFSHVHNIDLESHMITKHMKDHGKNNLSEETYEGFMRKVYIQTDNYIGRFINLLEDGWTIFIVSDHGVVCPEHEPLLMGDCTGTNVRLMQELGLTSLKKDADGNDLYEIDWEHTLAVASRGNHIYVNLKDRDPHGIVDPKDKYEVEEEIMTRLYGYKHPETGKRVIALAIRNKDAILLGMGGDRCGDIIYFNAEGYNYDHCDSLSTTTGCQSTSVSPIFISAGPGIKEAHKTKRVIREVDVAPTIAYLGGVRMPAQCEGAIIYQILTEEI